MAKRYEKHPDIEKKFRCPICTYGDDGKSRQAVTNHFKKNHEESEPEIKTEPEIQSDVPIEPEPVTIETPDWLDVDFGEGGDPVIGSIPLPAKGFIKSLSANPEPAAQTPQAMREWYKQQAVLLRYFLAGVVDPLIEWYGRGVTLDPTFSIDRSKDDWALLESVGEQWFAYRGISFPVNPDMLMVGTLGVLYFPQVNKIRKERDPSITRFNPLVKFRQWRERRAIRKAIKLNPINAGSDGYGGV